MTIEEKIQDIFVEMDELCGVRLSHCVTESPIQSLEEFDGCRSSVSDLTSVSWHSNFAKLQSIEHETNFQCIKALRLPYSTQNV